MVADTTPGPSGLGEFFCQNLRTSDTKIDAISSLAHENVACHDITRRGTSRISPNSGKYHNHVSQPSDAETSPSSGLTTASYASSDRGCVNRGAFEPPGGK